MNEVDVLLINTHRQHQVYRNPTGDWLGIHYLAAFLNENGISTLAFAGYAHEVPALLKKYIEDEGVRIIGFSCDYENQCEVVSFAKMVKENWNIPVVVGGPQAFALQDDFFYESGIITAICGEGELTLFEVVTKILDEDIPEDWSTVKGTRSLINGKVVNGPIRPLIQNLDALPFPNAKFALGNLFRPNIASFLTGRGCPFSCAFCYEGGNTKGYRPRSVENVIEEVDQVLSQRRDIHYILFTDDTFTVDLNRVLLFCEHLKKLREKYDFTWFCEGHVRTLCKDLSIIGKMVDAGMSTLQIGIESGDNEILQTYHKQITTEMIEKVVVASYQAGLEQLWGNIILGGACETPERIEKNIKFCEHLYELAPGMLNMDVVYFWPLPGTEITTHPDKFNMKIVDSHSSTSIMDFPVVEYPNISREDFCNLRYQFMARIKAKMRSLIPHIQPERVWNMLRKKNSGQNFSLWLKLISESESILKFYSLTECGATRLLKDIPQDEIWDWHPMRTGAPEKFSSCGNIIAEGEELSHLNTLLLIQASGKNSARQIYRVLNSVCKNEDDFISAIELLEKKCLLTFSRY